MLEFKAAAAKTFLFPAPVAEAYRFFADVTRMLSFMSEVRLEKRSANAPDIYRICYESTEMGVYTVQTYCDVRVEQDELSREIRLRPAAAADLPPIKGEMTRSYTVSTGELNATLTCMVHNEEQTMIQYQTGMRTTVPVTGMMRFVPLDPIQQMVQNLINNRLDQQIDQFIHTSIQTYSGFNEEQD